MGLKQVLLAGYNTTIDASAVRYNFLVSGRAEIAFEWPAAQCVPTDGKISRLFIRLSQNVAAGGSFTFTVMKNGVATALACTISAGAATGNNTADIITFTAGDRVSLRSTPSGTPGTPWMAWCTLWESSIAGESICPIHGDFINTASERFTPLQGGGLAGVRFGVQSPIPAGTFKKLRVVMDESPGVAPDAYRITLEVDGVASALTTTITAPDTTGSDLVNEVAVTAGQLVNIKVEALNTPANSPSAAIGIVFVAADNYALVTHGGDVGAIASDSAANYEFVSSPPGWNTTESNRYGVIQKTTLKNFYVVVKTAPGVGKSLTFNLRVNGANVGSPNPVQVTISGTNTTGSDTTNSYVVPTDGLTCGLMCTPSGTPLVDLTVWSFGILLKAKGWVQII